MGADDYLVQPFSHTELASLIWAALRKRAEPFAGEPSASYDVGGLSIDYAQRRVAVASKPAELTATEYAVHHELAVHAPRVLSRSVPLERLGEGRRCDRWRNEGDAVASSPGPMVESGSTGQPNNPAG